MACTKNADAADSTNRQTKQIFKAIASLLALITVGLFLACFGLGELAQSCVCGVCACVRVHVYVCMCTCACGVCV